MEYEWDEAKNERNIAERGISFAYAKRVFADPQIETSQDARRDYGEPRYVTVGHIEGRLHVVTHTPREENVTRIISARKANRREQRNFEALKKE